MESGEVHVFRDSNGCVIRLNDEEWSLYHYCRGEGWDLKMPDGWYNVTRGYNNKLDKGIKYWLYSVLIS